MPNSLDFLIGSTRDSGLPNDPRILFFFSCLLPKLHLGSWVPWSRRV